MKYITINTKEPIDLEEGTILRFLGQDKRFDYKDTLVAFEIIGNPVEEQKKIVFKYEDMDL